MTRRLLVISIFLWVTQAYAADGSLKVNADLPVKTDSAASPTFEDFKANLRRFLITDCKREAEDIDDEAIGETLKKNLEQQAPNLVVTSIVLFRHNVDTVLTQMRSRDKARNTPKKDKTEHKEQTEVH